MWRLGNVCSHAHLQQMNKNPVKYSTIVVTIIVTIIFTVRVTIIVTIITNIGRRLLSCFNFIHVILVTIIQ